MNYAKFENHLIHVLSRLNFESLNTFLFRINKVIIINKNEKIFNYEINVEYNFIFRCTNRFLYITFCFKNNVFFFFFF
jgi:hypothetical protein